MRKLTAIAVFLMLPIFLTSGLTIKNPGKKKCEKMPYTEDVYAVAAVVYAECRGEPLAGQIAVIDAIRNRAKRDNVEIWMATKKGMASGRIEERFLALVDSVMKVPVSNNYLYWYNPVTSTDEYWLRVTMDWEKDTIGRHVFMHGK